MRANNENLMNLLKNLVRASSQTPTGQLQPNLPFGGFGGLHGKKMLGLKNQIKGIAGGYVQVPPLKPLYSAINKTIKHIENQSVVQTRNIIIKASEEIETMKQYAMLPPLYGIGGTAIGGYEPL